jgi:hypothetical protein
MLRISEHRSPDRLVLKLEGRFLGEWVGEVDACWHAAAKSGEHASIWVDLTDVYLVDVAARALLARMHRAGVRFMTQGCEMPELVRGISES